MIFYLFVTTHSPFLFLKMFDFGLESMKIFFLSVLNNPSFSLHFDMLNAYWSLKLYGICKKTEFDKRKEIWIVSVFLIL